MRVRPEDDQNLGDCYVHVAIERHSKLVLNLVIGKRDQGSTNALAEGLRYATRGKFQITSDGHAAYIYPTTKNEVVGSDPRAGAVAHQP